MEEKYQHMPLVSDSFPPMTVNPTQGSIVLPGAFKARWFILFSHPADFQQEKGEIECYD